MANPNQSELELINMVQKVQMEQGKYWREKKKYEYSPTQLALCKKLERELKSYCTKRKQEIESKQQSLF